MASPGTCFASFVATTPPKAFKITKVILAFKFKSTTYLLLSMQGQGELTSMLQGQSFCTSPDVKVTAIMGSTLSFLYLPTLEMRSSMHESGLPCILEIPPVLLSCLPLLRSNAQLPVGILNRETQRPSTATYREEKNLSYLLQQLINSNLPFHLLLSESDLALDQELRLPSILDFPTVAGGAFSFSTTTTSITFLLTSALYEHPASTYGCGIYETGGWSNNNSSNTGGIVLQHFGTRRRGQGLTSGAGGGDDDGGNGRGNDYNHRAFINWLQILVIALFLMILLTLLLLNAWAQWQGGMF